MVSCHYEWRAFSNQFRLELIFSSGGDFSKAKRCKPPHSKGYALAPAAGVLILFLSVTGGVARASLDAPATCWDPSGMNNVTLLGGEGSRSKMLR